VSALSELLKAAYTPERSAQLLTADSDLRWLVPLIQSPHWRSALIALAGSVSNVSGAQRRKPRACRRIPFVCVCGGGVLSMPPTASGRRFASLWVACALPAPCDACRHLVPPPSHEQTPRPHSTPTYLARTHMFVRLCTRPPTAGGRTTSCTRLWCRCWRPPASTTRCWLFRRTFRGRAWPSLPEAGGDCVRLFGVCFTVCWGGGPKLGHPYLCACSLSVRMCILSACVLSCDVAQCPVPALCVRQGRQGGAVSGECPAPQARSARPQSLRASAFHATRSPRNVSLRPSAHVCFRCLCVLAVLFSWPEPSNSRCTALLWRRRRVGRWTCCRVTSWPLL
jgi:hypothetical protein